MNVRDQLADRADQDIQVVDFIDRLHDLGRIPELCPHLVRNIPDIRDHLLPAVFVEVDHVRHGRKFPVGRAVASDNNAGHLDAVYGFGDNPASLFVGRQFEYFDGDADFIEIVRFRQLPVPAVSDRERHNGLPACARLRKFFPVPAVEADGAGHSRKQDKVFNR